MRGGWQISEPQELLLLLATMAFNSLAAHRRLEMSPESLCKGAAGDLSSIPRALDNLLAMHQHWATCCVKWAMS